MSKLHSYSVWISLSLFPFSFLAKFSFLFHLFSFIYYLLITYQLFTMGMNFPYMRSSNCLICVQILHLFLSTCCSLSWAWAAPCGSLIYLFFRFPPLCAPLVCFVNRYILLPLGPFQFDMRGKALWLSTMDYFRCSFLRIRSAPNVFGCIIFSLLYYDFFITISLYRSIHFTFYPYYMRFYIIIPRLFYYKSINFYMILLPCSCHIAFRYLRDRAKK